LNLGLNYRSKWKLLMSFSLLPSCLLKSAVCRSRIVV
jgi:hypothetical protein